MTNKKLLNIGVGILDYPGSTKAVIFGLTDMFEIANQQSQLLETPSLHCLKVRTFDLPLLTLPASSLNTDEEKLSILIIPPTRNTLPEDAQMSVLLAWIRHQHGNGAMIASVCGGVYLLAASGLAAGREITTHWAHRDVLQAQYPDVTVNTEQLIIDNGDILTAGGLMAWTDIGLLLIDRFLGTEVMVSTARFMIIDPAQRTQQPYAGFYPKLGHGDAAVLKIQHLIHQLGGQGINVSDMADSANLNLRTFLRRFYQATGFNPGEYCQRFRVSASRNMLINPKSTIEQVAWKCGYHDVSAYRKIFKRFMGISPSEYRSRFLLSL
ncbi:GlxA family transcriptional regulator [Pseudomonas sp. SDO528_S397]